ncbi:hypothetical protein HWV62_2492 [Athelia sp. TMB]|nr:hypothetical protein HWV62_2492 [Athelia sp. TMB]
MPTVHGFSETFPNELLLEIFGSLGRFDLFQVVQTSRQFHCLALRLLYRDVIWQDPRRYLHSIPVWKGSPNFKDATRSVVIGVCEERYDHIVAATVVEPDGSVRRHVEMPGLAALLASAQPYEAHRLTRHKIDRAASSSLFNVMIQHLSSFTALNSLIFKKAIVPVTFYEILQALPSLRILRLETCSITSASTAPPADLGVFPITELTLLDLDVHRSSPHPLMLATSRNLRHLCCDMSACAFRMFTKKVPGGSTPVVPSTLDSIHFHMPEKRFWPANMLDFSENSYYFIEFLKLCPNMRHITIGGFIPSISLPNDIVPLLQFYQGPILAAASFARGRSILGVSLCDLDTGIDLWEWIQALQLLGECQSAATIHQLSAAVPAWDDEILLAVVKLFPEMRKLSISYNKGRLSETPSPGPCKLSVDTEAESELKGSIGSWDRHCPNLREVQLLPCFVWRRADNRKGEVTAIWAKRPYQMLPSSESDSEAGLGAEEGIFKVRYALSGSDFYENTLQLTIINRLPSIRFRIMLQRLAPETVDTIIDFLHADQQALFACSLTAKQWLPSTRFHIFSKVHLRPANIQTFADIVEAPCSSLPRMLRHLLINAFSEVMLSLGDRNALQLLHRVVPLLHEVDHLHICNSPKVESDLFTKFENIHHLTLSQLSYGSMDDVLRLVYSFPLLKSLGIKNLHITKPASERSVYQHHPGPKSLVISCLKGKPATCNLLLEWIAALNPIPEIQALNFSLYDANADSSWQARAVRLSGSAPIRSIDVDMNSFGYDVGKEVPYLDLSHYSNLRTLRVYAICLPSSLPPFTHRPLTLLSQITSSRVEEITFSFSICSLDSLKEFVVTRVSQAFRNHEFPQLHRLLLEIKDPSANGNLQDREKLGADLRKADFGHLETRRILYVHWCHPPLEN